MVLSGNHLRRLEMNNRLFILGTKWGGGWVTVISHTLYFWLIFFLAFQILSNTCARSLVFHHVTNG